MDLASEELLRRRLAELRPDDAILGEEEAFRPGTLRASRGWSTRSTARSTTSTGIAGVRGLGRRRRRTGPDGRPRPGHVDRARRVRARARGRPDVHRRPRARARRSTAGVLRVNSARPLLDSLVGTGFGYVASRRRAQGRIVAELLPQVRDIRRAGCAVARPVRGGRRGARPVLRARAAAVGPGGRRARSPRRRVRRSRACAGGQAQESMTVAGPPGAVRGAAGVLEALGADSDALKTLPRGAVTKSVARPVRSALESGAESHRAREQKARRAH